MLRIIILGPVNDHQYDFLYSNTAGIIGKIIKHTWHILHRSRSWGARQGKFRLGPECIQYISSIISSSCSLCSLFTYTHFKTDTFLLLHKFSTLASSFFFCLRTFAAPVFALLLQ